jgi:hypothetical protein
MQKTVFGNPALLVDDDAMHHRDLPRRPPERQSRDTRPNAHRLAQGRIGGALVCFGAMRKNAHAATDLFAGTFILRSPRGEGRAK